MYCYNNAQRYEQFLHVGRLDLAWFSSVPLCLRSSWWLYIFCLHSFLYLLVSWAWRDWPLTWLTNRRPSVLWHCWLGQLKHEIVPEMTHNVLSGTLTVKPRCTILCIVQCVNVWMGNEWTAVWAVYCYRCPWQCVCLYWTASTKRKPTLQLCRNITII